MPGKNEPNPKTQKGYGQGLSKKGPNGAPLKMNNNPGLVPPGAAVSNYTGEQALPGYDQMAAGSKASASTAGGVKGNGVLGGVEPSLLQPKVYDSVGAAGSGFVNLSHLLGLNRGSGSKSANQLSSDMWNNGSDAWNSVVGAENDFKSATEANTIDAAKYKQPGLDNDPVDLWGSGIKDALDKSKAGYQGPTDFTATGGYADLSKKVGDAGNMATNLAKGGQGIAAEVNKKTGLSPVQSAASAFYMGVNNSGVKGAGKAFTVLNNALTDANARAVDYVSLARKTTAGSQDKLQGMYDQQLKDQQQHFIETEQKRINDKVAASEKRYEDEKIDTVNKFGKDADTFNSSDATYANIKGVPQELIRMGMTYDEWVEAGKPNWETYKKNNPDAEATYNEVTGRNK